MKSFRLLPLLALPLAFGACNASKKLEKPAEQTAVEIVEEVVEVVEEEVVEAKNNALKIDYDMYSLDNGLDVILHKDDSDPIVSVGILFHVGSNREVPGRTGFAHFFEHMLFQNSENVGKGNFFKTINELGGGFNGGTWTDGTVYYEVVPKDALEKILWMESDRMGFMINTVTDAVFQNEKQVVKNEKRQRVDNQPYGHTNYVIGKALYPEGHPYNWQTIGSLADLDAATLEDVKTFYEKWYGPGNATMVIAGDIDMADTKKMIAKYFDEIPAKAPVKNMKPMPAKLDKNISLVHEDNFAQLPEIRMVWPTVEDGHADSYALDYLAELLSSGKRAPLYKKVVEGELAPNVSTYNYAKELSGEFYVTARSSNGVDLDDVQKAVFEGLAEFEANGIDDRDMERIKNSLETDFYNGISSVLSKTFQLAQMNEFRGSPEELEREIPRILGVTKDDVMRVYKKYIKGKNYLATSFVPKGQLELALTGATKAEVVEEEVVPGAEAAPLPEDEAVYEKTPSKIDRSVAPPLGAPAIAKMPYVWEGKTKNGMQVLGMENNELPLVNFSLTLKGGMLLDDPNKIGVANLLTDIMQEGTKNKTPEQLEDAIGQLGANLGMYTTAEEIVIQGNCLSRNYEAVMTLLEEMLLEPRWDAAEFDRIKAATIAQIQQAKAQPNRIASRVYSSLLYGSDHILAQSTLGTEEVVNSLTIDDVKAYYHKNFSPSVATFHVVGAVDQDRVMKRFVSMNNKWTNKEVNIPTVPAIKKVDKPVVYFYDIPGAKQSIIRIGSGAMKGGDASYIPSTVANYRLGAGSNGRLFQQLREERGYTYGAYSSFARRANQGFFVAHAGVRANVTKESVMLFKEILDQYKDTYTAEDLSKTQTAMVKSNARAFETLGDKLGILENMSTYGLSRNYIEQEEKTIMDMSLEDAKSYISKYINPNNMIYVVIGDAATQLEPLKEAGVGEVIQVDVKGNPINK